MPEETKPEVLATSLPQEQSPPPAADLLPSGTDQTSAQLNPSISTDKNDYTPNETAIISGKDLKPNTEYKIIITAEKFVFEDKFTTTEQGTFIYSFPLGGTFRPDYKVEVKDSSGQTVASVTFTDSCNGNNRDLGCSCANNGECASNNCSSNICSSAIATLTPTPISVTSSTVQTIEASCMEVAYGGSLNLARMMSRFQI